MCGHLDVLWSFSSVGKCQCVSLDQDRLVSFSWWGWFFFFLFHPSTDLCPRNHFWRHKLRCLIDRKICSLDLDFDQIQVTHWMIWGWAQSSHRSSEDGPVDGLDPLHSHWFRVTWSVLPLMSLWVCSARIYIASSDWAFIFLLLPHILAHNDGVHLQGNMFPHIISFKPRSPLKLCRRTRKLIFPIISISSISYLDTRKMC